MNVFELLVFVTYWVVGFYLGVFLVSKLGKVWFIPGFLAGFLLSFGCFYGLAKWNERELLARLNERELTALQEQTPNLAVPDTAQREEPPLSLSLLGALVIDCAVGYYLGKLLAQKIGVAGWIYGVPLGFFVSAGGTRWLIASVSSLWEGRRNRSSARSQDRDSEERPRQQP
jgi:hypothetical protein